MVCRLSVLFFVTALLGVQPAFPTGAATHTIRVGGTGGALKTLEILGAAFAETGGHPVEVMPNLGSGGGIKALKAGAIDLAVLSRPPTASESEGLHAVEYARTPFVFAVGREPVEGITLRQIVDLYSGRTTRWPGGEPVRIVLRPDTDSDNAILRAMSPAVSRALDLAMRRKGMVMAFSDQAAADQIATMPGGVGPTTLAIIKAERFPLKPLALDGAPPSLEALGDGRYPYFKAFLVLYRSDALAAVTDFVSFLRSPAARPTLENLGQRQVAD